MYDLKVTHFVFSFKKNIFPDSTVPLPVSNNDKLVSGKCL